MPLATADAGQDDLREDRVAATEDPDAPPIIGGLQMERRPEFNRREWFWQRVGWAAWLAVLAAALAGLLGDGPLSDAEATSADESLTLQYERFLHRHDPTELRLTVRPTGSGDVRLGIDNRYLQGMQIERIVPEPHRVLLGREGQTLVFPRRDDASATTITVYCLPEGMGRLTGSLGVEGATPIRFWQFVYP